MHRFFAPTLDVGDETVVLPKDEAEHLRRVLRLGVGDTVSVFDGRGHEFVARVTVALPRETRVQLMTRLEPPAEATVPITIAQAVLKGDKMDDVVRDAVMLGASAIQPLVTKRTEVTVAALLRASRVERWRRVAVASVKQSHRAVVPDIRTPLSFDSHLEEPFGGLQLMLVEPQAHTDVEPISVLKRESPPADVSIWIGPEGGWDEREWKSARERGVRLISLGQRTLRADAVPVAIVSILSFLWEH
ncbi:MAG TPA: RsmE family RNA methyltransferase [Vicinamibacterales bacterium]